MLNVQNIDYQGLGANRMPKRTGSNGKCGVKILYPVDHSLKQANMQYKTMPARTLAADKEEP
jgi:hypothetical protein